MEKTTGSRLDQVIDDLKAGHNIDLYASVVVAFILIVLNVFGFIDQRYFVAVTMAVLAILTYTIVGLKHDLTKVRESIISVAPKHEFQSDFPSDFHSRLDAANQVWFSGTHLSSVITSYHDLLQKKLKRGGGLRFMLVSPDGQASLLASKRFPGAVPAEQERIRIATSLRTLAQLAKENPDQVEIRIIDFPLEYTTYFVDPESPSAVLYLERATYKISGGMSKPKFVYTRHDGKWFEHLSTEAKLLWNDAVVWKEW